MRGLCRNMQTIWYALYQGKEPLVDENGNRTGEYTDSYSEPKKMRMNLAPVDGYAEWNPFGIDSNYDIAAMTFDVKSPICETTIVWVGKLPDEPHNYAVRRVAKSLNNIVYALEEVKNAGNQV